MKLAFAIAITTLLLPTLAGSAVASVAAAPLAARTTALVARTAPLFPWVPEGGYADAFPLGECTWWAAYNHPVKWGGNAGDWLTNAARLGAVTTDAPSVGAVVVYRPGGAYSELGHVAIVTAVGPDTYTVSEMHAPTLGVVSTRVIRWPDPAVLGFIPRSDA